MVLYFDRFVPPGVHSPKILALIDFLVGLISSLSAVFKKVYWQLYSLSPTYLFIEL